MKNFSLILISLFIVFNISFNKDESNEIEPAFYKIGLNPILWKAGSMKGGEFL
jgi:hypothetical protein